MEHQRSHGTFSAVPSTVGTSIGIEIDSAILAGSAVLVSVASAAGNPNTGVGTPSGASNNHVTLTDDSGLGVVWTKVGEVTEELLFLLRTGVTISLWKADLEVDLPSETIITCTLTDGRSSRVICVDSYDKGGLGFTSDIAGFQLANGRNHFADIPATVTLTNPESLPYKWRARGAWDAAAVQAPTIPTFWEEDVPPIFNGGDNSVGMTLFGQWRDFETSAQTWIPEPDTTRGWALILVAFSVVPVDPDEPDPPQEGEREYLVDFDTASHGLLGASITRRPDAVSFDYLTAFCRGPTAVDALVLNQRRWKFRVVGNDVFAAVSNAANDGYEAEVLLFTYTGAFIAEMDAAFTAAGQPVIVAERPTGTDDAPQVWVYAGPSYTPLSLGNGRTPRALLDYRGPCGPDPHVQIVFLKTLIGMMRVSEEEDYLVEHGTPLGYNDNYYLEDFFITTDDRCSVIYSVRDTVQGEYELRRVDSVAAPIPRPVFVPQEGEQDIIWQEGAPWRNPAGSTVTDAWELMVLLLQDCDEVELQCSNTIPQGNNPAFPEQNQTLVGPFLAGQTPTFSIDVTHGNDSMQPFCFRVRTKSTVGEITCYSKWRYHISEQQLDIGSPGIVLLNCDRDVCITPPATLEPDFAGAYPGNIPFSEVSRYERNSNPCGPIDEAEECLDPSLFEGGWNTGILWRQDWDLQSRMGRRVAFVDDNDEAFDFVLRGAVVNSSTSGNGGPTPLPGTGLTPIQFP